MNYRWEGTPVSGGEGGALTEIEIHPGDAPCSTLAEVRREFDKLHRMLGGRGLAWQFRDGLWSGRPMGDDSKAAWWAMEALLRSWFRIRADGDAPAET